MPLCRTCGCDLTTYGERALEVCTACIQASNTSPIRVSIPSPSYGFSHHGSKDGQPPYPD